MNQVISDEISYLQELLDSIPFSSESGKYFLRIYKLDHRKLNELNNQPQKFPIDANKLLKLGISLGNLIKTFQVEQDSWIVQNQQQRQFLNAKNNKASKLNLNDEQQGKPVSINTINQQQPYQNRFVKNLFTILKNYDIGTETFENNSNRDSYGSNSTPKRIFSGGNTPTTTNVSPIKLNSRQLLIEKLEININLDNLFIYKITLKLFVQIYKIIQQNISSQMDNTTVTIQDVDESSSIFSSNSSNSQDTHLTNDEYFKIVTRVLDRTSLGIVQPFVILLYKELVENQVTNEFSQLIRNIS